VLRIGLGHDTHRLVDGGPLRLGGIDIPFDRRMEGHSDADVLLHAITDALLGAAGDEDLGQLFPDTDPAHAGRDSADMLARAWQRVRNQGWSLVNLDCVLFAERPKIAPYKPSIRNRIAEILSVDVACCGLKAKTGEAVGAIGRGEAIAAQCVVLLTSR
jgi:2-C-methyl-D-erythritol 2,4-cyclodiphosphate synthase